jgi:peptidoglycan-N-acetylglucosamine deacetylase
VSRSTYLTTSWDDGHPLDLRVADLLTKYGLRGTFYAPMRAQNGTMTVAQIRELGRGFEIGAHTLDHVTLTRAREHQAWQQIVGSKSWLEDSTGLPCPMFCPPEGKYSGRHLKMVQRAGYLGLRSVELASLDWPRPKAGLMLMPTSIQAHPHSPVVFYKNAVKRAAFGNLWRYIVHGCSTDWPALAGSLLRRAIEIGGVFHLWGHSWELQQTGQWQRLDEVLRMMRQFAHQALLLTNGQICQQFAVPARVGRYVE